MRRHKQKREVGDNMERDRGEGTEIEEKIGDAEREGERSRYRR